ncbi:MAG: feruloyl-CoA synthase [Ascidiaceihabitans sp.]|nr:feruloyl-CoA synthase [Ascidiaceihabitans sp.]
MTDHLHLKAHSVQREDRADGSIILNAGFEHGPVAPNTGTWLHQWALATPDQILIAQRSGAGWQSETYASVLQKVRRIAGALLARGLGADTRIMILSGNGIDHALLSLAAQYVGIPSVPVAEQYSLIPAAHGRLKYIADLVRPQLVFASDGTAYADAIKLVGCDAVCTDPGVSNATSFADFMAGSEDGVDAAHALVNAGTVAKILMTSGSTSDPKGVLTTQGMMCTNQEQLAGCLPFLTTRPPILVDWLPWNHVFGGSHNFNMALANGGSLYIDDGKPMPAMFRRTLENLGKVSGTLSFNVPVGFAQLVQAMENDAALRQSYFSKLDMIFYAGASLPQDTWDALERMALDTCGRLPLITSSWGLTETAPAALLQYQPATCAGMVGVPVPGVQVKLIPDADNRCEVRVKGASIMTGYFENPVKTAEAFDEEGYFRTGDAMRFVDEDDPSQGLRFEGRISEEFKLQTGTWVHAATLRLATLAALTPWAQDVVITGAGRADLGVLIVPNMAHLTALDLQPAVDAGALTDPVMMAAIGEKLAIFSARATGSATRIARALVMADPPSMGAGEATAKGNINFAKLLSNRGDLLERLYSNDPATIVVDAK